MNYLRNFILEGKKKLHDNRNRFGELFGANLDDFWDLTGFDVIELDELVRPNEGESTEDCILRKYGQEAVDLCRILI